MASTAAGNQEDRRVSTKLHRPLIRSWVGNVHGGKARLRLYDQPGRWMSDAQLERLRRELETVARSSMEETPTYGVFSGTRASFANRLVGVMSTAGGSRPIAFTALVYLPVSIAGVRSPVLHLGLTMIEKGSRRQGLQRPLLKHAFVLASINQRRLRWTITNVSASPASIGAVCDSCDEVYPSYHGGLPQLYHFEVARKVLEEYRHEFGCSLEAVFDETRFVVVGANDPKGGGSHQFARATPVSRYRHQACNEFCRQQLRFDRGDVIFQVAKANLLRVLFSTVMPRCSQPTHGGSARDSNQTADLLPSGSEPLAD